MSTLSKDRFFELDGLRGWAAFLVVAFHMPAFVPALFELNFVRNGYLMVELFFVISGFVIYESYAGSIQTPAQAGRFIWLRFWRLYPIHFVVLMAYLFVEFAKLVARDRFGIGAVSTTPFVENSWDAFWAHLFLVHAFTADALRFNYPSWSISVEFWTYLIFLPLLFLARRFAPWHVFVLAGLLCVGNALLGTPVSLWRGLAGFSLGLLVAATRGGPVARRLGPAMAILKGCCLSLYLLLLTIKPPEWRYDFLFYVPSAMLVWVFTQVDGRPSLLAGPLSQFMGRISYSMYMVHALVFWLATQFARLFLTKTEIQLADRSHPALSSLQAGVYIPVVVACVLLSAWMLSKLVEEPVRLWSRKRFPGAAATRVAG